MIQMKAEVRLDVILYGIIPVIIRENCPVSDDFIINLERRALNLAVESNANKAKFAEIVAEFKNIGRELDELDEMEVIVC